ncbi:AAA family ATPase [Streptomyces sp. NPDC001822]|uniref:AAA family ATPase n=1 Tax=Streptomyces sp. NPDC001822 TaxID=3364614 RepID=UPI0036B8D997
MGDDLLAGLPPRSRIAELILGSRPRRDTFAGWQHYRRTRGRLVPPPRLTPAQRQSLGADRRTDYDLYRRLTNANLPLQDTPMLRTVTQVINLSLNGNTLDQEDPTLPGVMVSGWGNHGKTATVSSIAAQFEDSWLELHDFLHPTAVAGTADLHAPVVYVSLPVTASPKSVCETILNFFSPEVRKMTLPQLLKQVADSLTDHGVKALIIDDVNRLRMHRADDQDVLDLIRTLMSLNVTLILAGVNIPGTGLLREARWDRTSRQWVMPPLESTRVHGLEVTQTERRFELVELDRFRYTTPAEMQDFTNHLQGIEDHLRLLNAHKGMLTSGGMPEYLMRRSEGVVGILGRLVKNGSQIAMDSGREMLDEALLDKIVIGRAAPSDQAAEAEPQAPPKRSRGQVKSSRARGRNTVFDDRGPQAADEAS